MFDIRRPAKFSFAQRVENIIREISFLNLLTTLKKL